MNKAHHGAFRTFATEGAGGRRNDYASRLLRALRAARRPPVYSSAYFEHWPRWVSVVEGRSLF